MNLQLVVVIDVNYLDEIEEHCQIFNESWFYMPVDAIERKFKDNLRVLIDDRDDVEKWLVKHRLDTGLVYYFIGKTVQKYREILSKVCSTIFYKRGEWENINKLLKSINGTFEIQAI